MSTKKELELNLKDASTIIGELRTEIKQKEESIVQFSQIDDELRTEIEVMTRTVERLTADLAKSHQDVYAKERVAKELRGLIVEALQR